MLSLPDANSRLRVYVGHSVTHATRPFSASAEAFKGEVSRLSYCELLDFRDCEIGGSPSDDDVTRHCLKRCVPSCDVMVALVGEPSTTLGVEMGLALALGRPVIALSSHGETVSRVVKRLSRVWPHFSFVSCNELRTDGFAVVRDKLTELAQLRHPSLFAAA